MPHITLLQLRASLVTVCLLSGQTYPETAALAVRVDGVSLSYTILQMTNCLLPSRVLSGHVGL